eukprot:TRINITY_DN1459_c0_g1_i1.p1 TRINITY_DN1459_c0_g1~~TRINITY_DN1459_c0_g1_i1.p1  ORF type:complete len:182 (+),score=17.83 TRINITY_DN1459_c0_g1_i1:25-570(+)
MSKRSRKHGGWALPTFYRDTFLTENDIRQNQAPRIAAPDPNCHYLFDVPANSDLHAADFTRNPPAPSTGQPVRIHITHRENGALVDQEAELIFVGNGGVTRQVHNRNVDPGWIVVLPIEGEYTIHVQNLRDARTGVEIYVDGFQKENKRFLGLQPLELKTLKCHIVKTEEEFELDSSRAGS